MAANAPRTPPQISPQCPHSVAWLSLTRTDHWRNLSTYQPPTVAKELPTARYSSIISPRCAHTDLPSVLRSNIAKAFGPFRRNAMQEGTYRLYPRTDMAGSFISQPSGRRGRRSKIYIRSAAARERSRLEHEEHQNSKLCCQLSISIRDKQTYLGITWLPEVVESLEGTKH